jgi:predicted PurR-regulated permease PerM
MHQVVGGYVSGTLMVALIGGLFTTTLLLVLGVPYFLPLGLAMALLGVVPFLGAALGGTLVVTTTFLSAGARTGFIALVAFVLYQQVENHLLQPLVQRHTIQMNPLAIALVMLIGTSVAGVLGALLSLPLAAAGHILLQDVVGRRSSTAPAS